MMVIIIITKNENEVHPAYQARYESGFTRGHHSCPRPRSMFQGVPGPLLQAARLGVPLAALDLRRVQHRLREPRVILAACSAGRCSGMQQKCGGFL